MSLISLALSLIFACTTETENDSDTQAALAAENGLPEGESTWEGTFKAYGYGIPTTLLLENSGGDLSAEITFTDDPDQPLGIGTGVYSMTGTHEPGSGLIALAPEDWIQVPETYVELIGFAGVYDPSTNTMTGMAVDYASGADNSLTGGPSSLTWVSGDGAPTDFGDGELALPVDTRPYSGTYQCIGEERELAGELSYDGEGALSGTVSFGDLSLAESTNTFEVTGVHNPSTGGITLIPGLYTETDRTYAAFFVETAYEPAEDRMIGEGRVNVESCPSERWQAAF